MRKINWYIVIYVLSFLILSSLFIITSIYFSKIDESYTNVSSSLKNTEENYVSYYEILSLKGEIQENIEQILALGYIKDKNLANIIYNNFYSSNKIIKEKIDKIEKNIILRDFFKEIEVLIEKIIDLKKEELDLIYDYNDLYIKHREDNIKLIQLSNEINNQKIVDYTKIDTMYRKYKNIKNIKFEKTDNELEIIEKSYKTLKIENLTIYELERALVNENISKISTKFKELSELNSLSREIFIATNIEELNLENKINNRADIIVSSIYILNIPGYFAMDIFQEQLIKNLLFEYTNKLEKLIKIKKKFIIKEENSKIITDEMYELQNKIDYNKENSFLIINNDLQNKIDEFNKILTPVQQDFDKSTRESLVESFTINKKNERDIKKTILNIYIILFGSLFLASIISTIIIKKINNNLKNRNKDLEKNVEIRTSEIKENNNRLCSIQKIGLRIYNEKESKKAIELLLTVISKEKYYMLGFYLEKDSVDRNKAHILGIGINYNDFNEDKATKANKIVNKSIDLSQNDFLLNSFDDDKIYEYLDNKDQLQVGNYNLDKYITVPVVTYVNNIRYIYGLIVLELNDNITSIPALEKEALKIFGGYLASYFEKISLESEKEKNERLKLLLALSSSIVHELRTPVTSILGFSRLINSNNSNKDKLQMYSNQIEKECYRIEDMAKELIDYSSSHSYELYYFNKLNIIKLFDDVISNWLNEFKLNNGELCIDFININNEDEIVLDEQKIKKVFNYIIKNALESFNKEDNKLCIVVEKTKEYIVFEFKDNGRGIDEELLKKIFEPLVTNKIQGTGLGLSIVKNIIYHHNGKIDITSKLDLGTTLMLRFPI